MTQDPQGMWSRVLRFARSFLVTAQQPSIEVRDTVIVKVLFVCMGNICRSPMAEGTFKHMLADAGLVDKIHVESAGTHSFHVKAPPDKRGRETAARRGVDISAIRARQVQVEDFAGFDYLLAMDHDNYQYLLELCPGPEWQEKIRLLMDYAPDLPEDEVPDPYYGNMGGFERVMDLLETASQGLLSHIRERYRI